MSLKVLLADDSMTAQNMGKKILTDAGYKVVAVSNGAAAMKKIASEKPDILVLDVYMPGYTGLEVCEKAKADRAALPVLLTVGKLEPYKAEDGHKVRADGVIVKPFEATDLLNAVQKLAAGLGVLPDAQGAPKGKPADFEKTVKMAPLEFAVEAPSAEEAPPEPAPARTETIEVPKEVAAAAAFELPPDEPPVTIPSMPAPDAGSAASAVITEAMQGSQWFAEPLHEIVVPAPPAPEPVPAPSPVVPDAEATASIEASVAPPADEAAPPRETRFRTEAIEPPAIIAAAAAAAAGGEAAPPAYEGSAAGEFTVGSGVHDAAVIEPPVAPEIELEAAPAPAVLEPPAPAKDPEVEYTSPPPAPVDAVAEAGLESTMQASEVEAPPARDPALVTDATEMAQFTTRFGAAEPAEAAPAETPAPEEAPAPPQTWAADHAFPDDTAARVRLAEEFHAAIAHLPATPHDEPVHEEAALAPVAEPAPAAAATVPDPHLVSELAAALTAGSAQIATEAAASGGADPQTDAVSRAVQRALARLHNEIVAEVMRELKG
ncbi:MAG TPA: response regulator [Terriglobales bacterium]|nr:response regulator [Terriglobales bacterium]